MSVKSVAPLPETILCLIQQTMKCMLYLLFRRGEYFIIEPSYLSAVFREVTYELIQPELYRHNEHEKAL